MEEVTERRVTEEELRVWRAVILAPSARDIIKTLQNSTEEAEE